MKRVSSNLYILQNFNNLQWLYQPFLSIIPYNPTGTIQKPRKRLKPVLCEAFGRDEATRTPDPYVPNVVRYQLRYIPIVCVVPPGIEPGTQGFSVLCSTNWAMAPLFLVCGCKGRQSFWNCKHFRNFFIKSVKMVQKWWLCLIFLFSYILGKLKRRDAKA